MSIVKFPQGLTKTRKNYILFKPTPMSHNYFLQTQEWFNFWNDLNLKDHKTYYIETEYLTCFVRQYPWYFGRNFLYIPKGPVLKKNLSREEFKNEFKNLNQKIIEATKNYNITFTKYEFTPDVYNSVNGDMLDFLRVNISANFRVSDKHLQFLQTPILDTTSLFVDKDKSNITNENLLNFYQSNLNWWKERNNNVNRYTKKSLQKDWIISTAKTSDNFENFWKIYQETMSRQEFSSYSRHYFHTFFTQEASRIIIIKDHTNQPQGVWLGANIQGSLIYLYGGNTQQSFDNYGQYLIHLTALFEGAKEGIKTYDLGGYDGESGYSKFKENYKGKIIDFGPAFDLPNKPLTYKIILWVVKTIKNFKK